MEASGYEPAGQAYPPVPGGHERRLRHMRERAEIRFRSSAARMRAAGAQTEAQRAEQFADWARFDLDEPRTARLLHEALRAALTIRTLDALLDEVLDFGVELLRADRGNVQIANPATGTLTIASQYGFSTEFLDYFAVVTGSSSACGRAARRNAQVVIADVTSDPGFAPHREIAAASKFRTVQSTPLTTHDGRLVGMLSTHHVNPVTLPSSELQILRRFGTLIGERLAVLLRASPR